jgi:hypothetical protein
MTKKVKVGDYDATILETVEQFNNVVESTPDYKWLLWARQVNPETYGPLLILLRFKPKMLKVEDAIKHTPADRYWYAASIEVLLQGKKDVNYRG